MRSRVLLMALFPVAAMLAGCGGIATPDSTAETFDFYSIDGRFGTKTTAPPGGELFRGFPVLGKFAVKDAKTREEIVAAFKEGISRGGEEVKCFWPRHAIRTTSAGRTIDYVICFECQQYVIHDGKEPSAWKLIDPFPLETFNKILTQAGVPLAPSALAPEK